MKNMKILPIFLPFTACGNRCIYCNQSVVTSKSESEDIIGSASIQISTWLDRRGAWDEAAFYGGNFGAIERKNRLKLYELVQSNGIKSIRYSTRPDTISNDLLDEAKDYNINLIELGVQSLSDEVLANNRRPYSAKDVFNAIDKISEVTNAGVQLMAGMYLQDKYSPIEDAKRLSQLNIKTARIYPTMVLKDTKLEELFKKGDYLPHKLEEILSVAAIMYIYFEANGVKVIRMGLPDDILKNDGLIAGAFHEAFGDLVKTLCCALYYETSPSAVKFAGYKGFIKKNFYDKYKNAEKEADFKEICSFLKEVLVEDSKRSIEVAAARLARRLACSPDDR